MTWIQHHRESADHASKAEACLRLGNPEKARDLYVFSARAEELALKELHHSKVRTYGITAVSAASLYFKAGQLDCAERIAMEGMAFDGLPAFARHQLRHIVQVVWAEQERQTRKPEVSLRRQTHAGVLRAVHLDRDWLEVAVGDSHIKVVGVGEQVDDVIGPFVNKRVLIHVASDGETHRFVDIEPDD